MIEIKKSDSEETEKKIIGLLNEQYMQSFSTNEHLTTQIISISASKDEKWIGGAVASLFGNTLHLSLLAVDQSYRHEGIGSRLIEAVQQTALENQCLYMTVNTQDYQAREFYERHGFEVFASVENMPFVGTTKFYLKQQIANE
ncbi:GNAT family N-acetyltransferase [Enterococcus mundtii]|uniref:Acetyltransferase n=2 Tax=Enterococcus TaxID=1350 RepID=A0AAI8WCV9_ENTMU|nr:GNAT family N-acetyltransferase [Enterococcus mundtii]MCA6772891.1 GNAT family N-acetyltransferase [Enterococcus mundtii]QCJ56880.1 N-acetyltransferase [Enterococcus mundtii]UBM04387.1 GNAT family N-acetyltransferase [Enterococcus mundtii]BAO07502.1 acetyltransferase [Enterococcus mundtii QU 25]BBM13837.1 acetyltransferase [Enterococcus mundtii]